jgi:hypothetical protein
MMSIRYLILKARRYYPHSKKMRKAWVRQTKYLFDTGRHALLTGGFTAGNY